MLDAVRGLEWTEAPGAACCGFGGSFSCRFPELSVAMGERRLAELSEVGADYIVTADAGCMMQLEGVARAGGRSGARAVHLAEVLAGRV